MTDEAKRNAAVRSYQDVVRGASPRDSLLDIREVFSDDAQEKLSFVPQPGADGKAVLLQMCARCHDGRGNPQLSKNRLQRARARGDAARGEGPRHRADQRSGTTRMPPWRAGTLTPESIPAATLELQK